MSSARACLAAIVLLAALGGCDRSTPPPDTPPAAPPPAAAPAPAPPTTGVPQPAPALSGVGNDVDTPPAITDADIPPLPQPPSPGVRPAPIVRAVYIFAAKHPEILNKVPCFCGCESRGHRHNDDCFVASRDERGRPTAWEPHGVG